MEVLTQRQGYLAVGVPGHFDDVPFVPNQLQTALQAFLGGGAVEHDVTVGEGVIRVGEVCSQGVRQLLPARVQVHKLQAL